MGMFPYSLLRRHISTLARYLLGPRCASLLKKSPPHQLRQELIPPGPGAEGPRDSPTGSVDGPSVSRPLDVAAPQRRFPLSPERWSDSLRDDSSSPGYCERRRRPLGWPLVVGQCDDIVQPDNTASDARPHERLERAGIVTRDGLCASFQNGAG